MAAANTAYSLVAPPPGYAYADPGGLGELPGQGRSIFANLVATGEGCRTGAVTVRLQSRDAGRQPFVTRRTASTDSSGSVGFQTRPTRTAVVRAVATAPDGSQLVSPALVVRVRAAISATYTRGPGCRLFATGSTYPAKPGQPVRLQVGDGQGFSTVASGVADARGVYRIAWAAPCGQHDLVVYLPPTATNAAGRPLYVRLRVEARP